MAKIEYLTDLDLRSYAVSSPPARKELVKDLVDENIPEDKGSYS